jgi:hypothetical protein
MAEFIALLVAVSLPLACLPILWRLEQRGSGAQDATHSRRPGPDLRVAWTRLSRSSWISWLHSTPG